MKTYLIGEKLKENMLTVLETARHHFTLEKDYEKLLNAFQNMEEANKPRRVNIVSAKCGPDGVRRNEFVFQANFVQYITVDEHIMGIVALDNGDPIAVHLWEMSFDIKLVDLTKNQVG